MHPLDGPRLKIRRAKRQIGDLRVADDAFRAQADYGAIVAELNDQTGKYVLRALVNVLPPTDLGLCIGEAAHNLRSALDGLVYQLGKHNGANEEALARTQFPIYLRGRITDCKGSCEAGNRSHFNCRGRQMIGPLHRHDKAAIKRLQPYQPGNLGNDNPLYLLDEINNADKHRLLQVVGGKAMGYSAGAVWSSEALPDYHIDTRTVFEDGAEIGYAAAEDVHGKHVRRYQKILPYIAFWKGCDAVKGRGVFPVLSKLADHVSDVIECFVLSFERPPRH